jgi:hypothetical protein
MESLTHRSLHHPLQLPALRPPTTPHRPLQLRSQLLPHHPLPVRGSQRRQNSDQHADQFPRVQK